MNQVILFEHANFQGAHKHVFGEVDNLNISNDGYLRFSSDTSGVLLSSNFNDSISSIVVIEGVWRFFKDAGFKNQIGKDLGPGAYSWVGSIGIANDAISSLKPVG